jgi:plastocyanin
MTGYYVLAGISVAWALGLAAIGLTQKNFPPTGSMARALMGFAVVLALVTVAVLVSTTEVEHPLEEAAAEEQLEQDVEANQKAKQPGEERAAKEESEGGGANSVPEGEGAAGGGAPAGPKAVPVKENEFSIAIQGGTSLKAGAYDFQVANEGKIEHDLAIEDGGPEEKTPLIKAGGKANLKVDLKSGKYHFYCTVPGHAQSGMEQNVTVE